MRRQIRRAGPFNSSRQIASPDPAVSELFDCAEGVALGSVKTKPESVAQERTNELVRRINLGAIFEDYCLYVKRCFEFVEFHVPKLHLPIYELIYFHPRATFNIGLLTALLVISLEVFACAILIENAMHGIACFHVANIGLVYRFVLSHELVVFKASPVLGKRFPLVDRAIQ